MLSPSLNFKTGITEFDWPSQFASKVIHPGHTFIRCLYVMQDIESYPDHFSRLHLPARADIMWWYVCRGLEWYINVVGCI